MKANKSPKKRSNNGLYSMNPNKETMDINLKKIKFNLKVQNILSEPKWKLKESYTTKSGQIKNRYELNANSVIIKTINH